VLSLRLTSAVCGDFPPPPSHVTSLSAWGDRALFPARPQPACLPFRGSHLSLKTPRPRFPPSSLPLAPRCNCLHPLQSIINLARLPLLALGEFAISPFRVEQTRLTVFVTAWEEKFIGSVFYDVVYHYCTHVGAISPWLSSSPSSPVQSYKRCWVNPPSLFPFLQSRRTIDFSRLPFSFFAFPDFSPLLSTIRG